MFKPLLLISDWNISLQVKNVIEGIYHNNSVSSLT